jgi:hypothetical protein
VPRAVVIDAQMNVSFEPVAAVGDTHYEWLD